MNSDEQMIDMVLLLQEKVAEQDAIIEQLTTHIRLAESKVDQYTFAGVPSLSEALAELRAALTLCQD